jgi:hypothetical protein
MVKRVRSVTFLNAPSDFFDRDRAEYIIQDAFQRLEVPRGCATIASHDRVGPHGHWFLEGRVPLDATRRLLSKPTLILRYRLRRAENASEAHDTQCDFKSATCTWQAKYVRAEGGKCQSRRVGTP